MDITTPIVAPQFLLECQLRGFDITARCPAPLRGTWAKRRRMCRAVFEARSRNRAMPSQLQSSVEQVCFLVFVFSELCFVTVAGVRRAGTQATLPYHTLPYFTLPYLALPILALPYLTLHHRVCACRYSVGS